MLINYIYIPRHTVRAKIQCFEFIQKFLWYVINCVSTVCVVGNQQHLGPGFESQYRSLDFSNYVHIRDYLLNAT